MAYTHYYRKTLDNQVVDCLRFGPEHYAKVGIGYSSLRGIPSIEAFQLINAWNSQQHFTAYVYWL